MTVRDICLSLEELAPLSYQETYDNSGLICGDPLQEVKGVLLCLDCTEAVLEEALAQNCNMIIAHHPPVFAAKKRFTPDNAFDRVLLKAIRQEVALYACHTNLDNVKDGVNLRIAEKLGLKNLSILQPKSGLLLKLVTFVPASHLEQVRNAVFAQGAGHIGNYDSCSFGQEGTGTFRGNEKAKPFLGEPGQLSREAEVRVEFLLENTIEKNVLRALLENHPYEEPAFDIYPLQNRHPGVGSGMIGELPEALNEITFMELVKMTLNARIIRHTTLLARPIKRVAFCGGSGRFLLNAAIAKKADVFVTADFKYHDFFDVDGKLLLLDPGHFETEQFTPEIIYKCILNKFPKFAVRLSNLNTNPIHYF